MAAFAGRDIRIAYSSDSGVTYTNIAGAKTDGFNISREGIDITDKDDAAARTFLAKPGQFSVDANIEGLLSDSTLLELALDNTSTTLPYFRVTVGGEGSFAGEWFISGFEVSGSEGSEAATFTANIQSSGTVPWTAA